MELCSAFVQFFLRMNTFLLLAEIVISSSSFAVAGVAASWSPSRVHVQRHSLYSKPVGVCIQPNYNHLSPDGILLHDLDCLFTRSPAHRHAMGAIALSYEEFKVENDR